MSVHERINWLFWMVFLHTHFWSSLGKDPFRYGWFCIDGRIQTCFCFLRNRCQSWPHFASWDKLDHTLVNKAFANSGWFSQSWRSTRSTLSTTVIWLWNGSEWVHYLSHRGLVGAGFAVKMKRLNPDPPPSLCVSYELAYQDLDHLRCNNGHMFIWKWEMA